MSDMSGGGLSGKAWGILAQTTRWGTRVLPPHPALVVQGVPAYLLCFAGFSAVFSLVFAGGGERSAGGPGGTGHIMACAWRSGRRGAAHTNNAALVGSVRDESGRMVGVYSNISG